MHRNHYKHTLFLFLGLLSLSLNSCQKKGEKHLPVTGEYLYRLSNENVIALERPKPLPLPSYPWDERFKGKHPKITKEFFRCRGNPIQPVRVITKEGKDPLYFFDCGGYTRHGLPLKEDKEFIYPCLIEILNTIQEKTGKKVVITTGHRCPKHNAYSDPSPSNWDSKHMIGAEVDFYVTTLELEPEKIIHHILEYYKEHPLFKGIADYEEFQRLETSTAGVSTPPWFNKEIFIKLYQADEGRDCDNQHPYPYISIQVRFDRDTAQKVVYDKNAAQNFRRY